MGIKINISKYIKDVNTVNWYVNVIMAVLPLLTVQLLNWNKALQNGADL